MIEGFTANGELMATLPAIAALALTARWHARGGLRVMFLAGLSFFVPPTFEYSFQ